MNNIAHLFFDAAYNFPTHVAIIEGQNKLLYQDFEKQVKQTAGMLKEKGVRKGDRVLIFVPMSVNLYRTVLAVFYLGAVAVFLDEWVSKSRMELCCKIAKCQAFVCGSKVRVLSLFSSELRAIPIKIGVKITAASPILKKAATVELDDAALITFTTGSTGAPKAANRTHGFLYQQFKALLSEINPTPSDVDMPILPIVLLCNLAVGATSVIADFNARKPAKMKAEKVVQQIITHQVNRITASPFFLDHLCAHLSQKGRVMPGLKQVFTGGAPVFPQQVKEYFKVFTSASVHIAFGSTEAEPISVIKGKEVIDGEPHITEKGLCVGTPYVDIQLKIIAVKDQVIETKDDELKELVLKEGDVGEIVVSGKHVLTSYFNDDQALKRNKIFTTSQVWHRTGDSGRIVEGKLYLLGRCKQLIKYKDGYLSPFVYEYFIRNDLGFSCGTVLMIHHVLTLIIEDQSAEEKTISSKLLPYDSVVFLKKIPRDPRHHTKIDYSKLDTLLATLLTL